jgi:outer membrane usher protein FimD/PapC
MKLKSLTYGLLVLLFVFSGSQKVDAQYQQFRLGLKTAGNLGWITPKSKTIEQNGMNAGFSFGVMSDYHFQQNYALSTELLVLRLNGSVTFKDDLTVSGDSLTYTNVDFTYKLQYIEIPISIKFKTKEIGNITYWANFGLAPSFNIGAKLDQSGSVPQKFLDEDPTNIPVNKSEGDAFEYSNFEDDIFLVRVPLIIGGGIEYGLAGNTSLYAGVRSNNGFTDIFVKDKTVNGTNSFFSIDLGLFF